MGEQIDTHLFLATDVADDGVGGRTSGGAEDCHHPFKHNLTHWRESRVRVGEEVKQETNRKRELMLMIMV